MNGNPKSPFEEIIKDYNLTDAGVGVALPIWRPPAAEFLVVQQSHSDEVVEGPRAAPRFFPLLGHHLGPLLRVALRHFFCAESFELGLE